MIDQFCRSIYPNKPRANKSVNSSIRKKRLVFKQGVSSELHGATRRLKIEIFKAKQNYKPELENKTDANNPGSAWSSMKTRTGLPNPKKSSEFILDGFNSDTEFAKAL